MLILTLILWSSQVTAAGLDEPSVGGLYGTVAGTNPTAVWWNPAALAAEAGTRYHLDLGPTFRRLTIDSDRGSEALTDTSVVPFVGIASDFGENRLGVGFGLFVPQSLRLASEESGATPNRYALRSSNLRMLQIALAGGYTIADEWLSIGVSGSVVDGRQTWSHDVPTVAELAGDVGTLTDADFADPSYAATVTYDLEDPALTFGVGVYLRPFADEDRDRLAVSLAYLHGVTLTLTGTARVAFGCPADPAARKAADQQGICDTTGDGIGRVTLRLPSRVHVGVMTRPIDTLRLELFGSWVGWSRYADLQVQTVLEAEGASEFSRDRAWARDGRDVFAATLDAKFQATDRFLVGARMGVEQAAVPAGTLSAAHADGETIRVAGLAVFSPFRALELGLSYGRDFVAARNVPTSRFGLSLRPERPDRYRYGEASGRYALAVRRVGLVVRGRLGPPPPRGISR